MGRCEDVSFIPDKADLTDVEEAAKRFGLTWLNQSGSYVYNGPLLVVYRTEGEDERGLPLDHAVFISDGAPFWNREVITTVIGWNGDHDIQWSQGPTPAPPLSRWRRLRRKLGKFIIA